MQWSSNTVVTLKIILSNHYSFFFLLTAKHRKCDADDHTTMKYSQVTLVCMYITHTYTLWTWEAQWDAHNTNGCLAHQVTKPIKTAG